MSIAVLSQVYTEARRLAVAGSIVARGDFRLKKLLPPLAEAGKQAPVFAKIGEVATAVVEGPEDKGAESLLELIALTSAVLYTQGETGLAGDMKPIETTDLGAPSVPTSARVLKPLLEALTTTGSGRLELVKDAADRGLFRDLRLVKPAIAGLDDPYPEVADLLAEKVLPLYGKAILPELKAKYDPKGTKGHPRRLELMHKLDPAGTRELVKQALDSGSKEVKVAAIACLGSDPDDLNFLTEQASAKAQDVRAAAYQALAKLSHPAAVAVLEKALTGKDYQHAARAVGAGTNLKLVDVLIAEIKAGVAAMLKAKDKKQVSAQASRLQTLITAFPKGDHPAADALLMDLFDRREELAEAKGDTFSGTDVVEAAIQQLADGSAAGKKAIVQRHAEVPADQLEYVFGAAREVLSPVALFDTFSPYLTAKVDAKKKGKDPAAEQRDAVVEAICSDHSQYYWDEDEGQDDPDKPPLDPRWLDLAVEMAHAPLVSALGKPGHKGALAFAELQFHTAMKKAKTPDDARSEWITLLRLKHPLATDALFQMLAKRKKGSPNYYWYWFARMAGRLPATALPRLEEYVGTLPEKEQDPWLDAIQELRTK